MIYVQLYNNLGMMIGEVEVKKDETVAYAIFESLWTIEPGDTIKVVEEFND